MQRCSRSAYRINGIAGLVGFGGLICFVISIVWMCFGVFVNAPLGRSLWLFGASIFIGFLGRVLHWYSFFLVNQKGFTYDSGTREGSWLQGDSRVTYKFSKELDSPFK